MAASSSPCCVECGAPVPSIVQRLGADSVRLARCESCGHVADKYAEFEPTLIVIDLLLYRPSAYRHVLINRQVLRGREEHEALLWRLGGALLLFDAYLTRSRLGGGGDRERDAADAATGAPPELEASSVAFAAALVALALAELLGFCVAAAAAARSQLGARACESWRQLLETVVLSSFGRSLVLLDMIWVYPLAFCRAVELFVLLCNGIAIKVQLRCSTPQAAAIVAAGAAAKGLSQLAVVAAWYAFSRD